MWKIYNFALLIKIFRINCMIQVINRALNILELVSKERDREFSLSEIANSLNLNASTCANIIKTLVTRGYLEQQGKKQ